MVISTEIPKLVDWSHNSLHLVGLSTTNRYNNHTENEKDENEETEHVSAPFIYQKPPSLGDIVMKLIILNILLILMKFVCLFP